MRGEKGYKAVRVQITKYVSEDPQPGIVECRLVDAWNQDWIFVEKTAIVSSEYLDGNSPYPLFGLIACEIIEIAEDKDNRKIVTINTERPWHIEDVTGVSQFQVLVSQICEVVNANIH